MAIELIERGRVQARGEDGAVYDVVEYQMVVTAIIDAAVKKTKSGLVYSLADGRDVWRVNADLFQIADTRKLIERI